jgi:hypothetical protein
MLPTRREVLAQLAALVALPLMARGGTGQDPLDGTIADYRELGQYIVRCIRGPARGRPARASGNLIVEFEKARFTRR